jgi:7-cyano-7-deazaguanine tRNA-ribosyltransferase
MLVVAGLSLRNLEPRVWDARSPYYLPDLRGIMVSYADFHQNAVQRRAAMRRGVHAFLGVPADVQVYLDNGAFHFLRQGGTAASRAYGDFVRRARPDWYPVRFDAIPTPKMPRGDQEACFEQTMRINRAYQHDGFVPVIHVSSFLAEYIAAIQRHSKLAAKDRLALGGLVPNLLRSRKALPYAEILASLQRVRREFPAKQMHVFGIGGTATLHLAALLGVNSADSSGWRNRAARGIVQLPGSGDRMIGDFGKWRGRVPTDEERAKLSACQCPACLRYSLAGLQENGIRGFCNRATHNLYVLLEEAAWLRQELNAGTYRQSYRSRLNNSAYLPLVESVLALSLREESLIAVD